MPGPYIAPNLGLTYQWVLGSNDWNTGMDTNLQTIDALMGLAVKSATVTAPPGSPANGDRYIIPTGATGAWASQVSTIAVRIQGAWKYFIPPLNQTAIVLDSNAMLMWNSTAWVLAPYLTASGLWMGTSSGSANAQTFTPASSITSYTTGAIAYVGIAGYTNTGPMTVNISGVGSIAVNIGGQSGPQALTGGEWVAGNFVVLRSNGSVMVLDDPTSGTVATKNLGTTIIDPGTGKLEISHPLVGGTSAISGSTRAFVATDRGQIVRRTNSGVAMTDTLPGSTLGVMPNGWSVTVINSDTVNLTVNIGAGIGVTVDGAASIILTPGSAGNPTSMKITSDGTAYYSERGAAANLLATANVWPFQQSGNVNALTDGSSIAWALATGQVSTLTLAATGHTLAAPTGQVNGTYYSLLVTQGGSGSNVINFASTYKGVSNLYLTTTNGAIDHLVFRSNGTYMMLVSYKLNVGV